MWRDSLLQYAIPGLLLALLGGAWLGVTARATRPSGDTESHTVLMISNKEVPRTARFGRS